VLEAMKRREPDREKHWSVDRKVPIALILAMLGQTGGLVWWASGINQRVSALEERQSAATASAPVQADRLTRVETKVETIQRDVTEIKSDIKSLIVRPMPGAK
jgi:hypothetical protein